MGTPQENEQTYIGHNNPPIEYNPAVYEQFVTDTDKLISESEAMFTGVCVETEEQFETVENLRKALAKLRGEGSASRLADKKPYKDMGDLIQSNYAAQEAKIVTAEGAGKACVAPYLKKQEEKRQADADAAREAEAQAQLELEAAQAEKDPADMESMTALNDAADKVKDAEKARGRATKKTATGLKTVFTPTIKDKGEVIKHYWTEPKLNELLLSLINADIRSGKREIPGVEINEERVAR